MRKRLIALGALAAAIGALVGAAPASASHNQVTFFDASNQLSGQYGAGVRIRALNELQALGVDVVRFEVYWRNIAPNADSPTPPAGFDPRNPLDYGNNGDAWNPVDEVVKGANQRGMRVALVLTGAPPTGRVPRWASQDPNGNQSDPSPGAFSDFAEAVAKRYGGGPGSVGNASYISIWNEPNSATFLRAKAGQGPGQVPALYRQLVVAGQQGLAAAGYTGRVLAGELGPAPPGKLRDPLGFTRAAFCLNRAGKRVGACPTLDIAGWAHHPYSFSTAPFHKPFGNRTISFANIGKMQRLINQGRRTGAISRSAQLYVTEYGYPSRPDSPIGVPRRQQAEFTAIADYMAYNNPGIASFAQYLLRDDPKGTAAYGFASGLCPANSHDSGPLGAGVGCKPEYGAFRTPLVVRARSSKRVTIWGHVRPGRGPTTSGGPARVTIRYLDPGGKAKVLRTVTTNAAGYFQFGSANKRGRLWGASWNRLKGPLVRAYRF